MLKRYLITIGATTTAGGEVTSGCAFMSINDAHVALEGDTVWCPACGSEGVIALDGPRLPSTFDGREEALGDDLCMCKCSPPPRLVAAQSFEWQEIDTDWHAQRSEATARAAAQLNGGGQRATPDDAVPLLLLDRDTQAPLRHRPYRLQLSGGGVIEGSTDGDGATRPLSAAERASVLAWQFGANCATREPPYRFLVDAGVGPDIYVRWDEEQRAEPARRRLTGDQGARKASQRALAGLSCVRTGFRTPRARPP